MHRHVHRLRDDPVVIVEDEEDVYEEEEGQSLPLVRRSTRVSTKPAYLDDYVLFADIECEKLLMI